MTSSTESDAVTVRRVARRIVFAYFLFATAWIVVSDWVLFELTDSLPSFAGAELLKGIAFVLVTTGLLYLFVTYQFRPYAEAAERRRAEARLSEAEERYRALFERSLDCVFLADFQGNFLDANRAALDLLGYSLEARVLAVADTVEAMASHRPYRPGLGIEKALEEVEKNRGRLYCPLAVDACLRLFREKDYKLPA